MARRGGFPGGMPGNMNNLMKQAQKMQKQMAETQQALEEKTYEASAGGGVVSVTVSGKREVTAVKIAEEVVDPDDIEMLEDLVAAAVNATVKLGGKAYDATNVQWSINDEMEKNGSSLTFTPDAAGLSLIHI